MRSLFLVVIGLLVCLAARADAAPPAARELCRIPGPAGNAFVVTHTRLADPGVIAGWWPQQRLGEIEAIDSIQVQAEQKDRPAIVIGAYVLPVRRDNPETGIEVLASLLEPHYLWLVVREGSYLRVRRFSMGGGFIDTMGTGPWSSYTTPAPRRMGAATATIRREGETVVVDVEDHQQQTSTTYSRFAWRKGQSDFEPQYRNVGPASKPATNQ